ncbi:MAG: aminotransferase class I/II-fold pyridoxal phosphate-dependent enzyme [Planctomycetes bacterium]|nr:aminotransferase class I/II-fold pyridoxal phosphate-dependent enzyme [Planctomycetota bacterium]MBI3844967.1 aminotransferase class I/II-fold pyridoxal phosphate-dependent enzyme [Planctomycetota bacterium]
MPTPEPTTSATPVREVFLPFAKPVLGEEEIAEVVDSLRSGWLTTGPKVQKLEEAFRAYTGAHHAIAISSCTAALHVAYAALGIGPNDEIVTTPMTFSATTNMAVVLGARPVFVDIDRHTLNIDVERIEAAITPRTKAIVPVHFAGQPVDLDGVHEIARRRGVAVVEDAAHAIGTEYKGRRIGALSQITCFSFHPNKNVTTGEGGLLTTDDSGLAETLIQLRFHGLDKDAWRRFTPGGNPLPTLVRPGFKYNMMDIQAAIGIHQLPRLEGFIKKRTTLAERYRRALAEVPELLLPESMPFPHRHAWHLFAVLLDTDRAKMDRNEFMSRLKAENIGTGVHYTAVHLFPWYQENLGVRRGDFPNAEFVSDRILSLPLWPGMEAPDVDDVVAAIKRVLGRKR